MAIKRNAVRQSSLPPPSMPFAWAVREAGVSWGLTECVIGRWWLANAGSCTSHTFPSKRHSKVGLSRALAKTLPTPRRIRKNGKWEKVRDRDPSPEHPTNHHLAFITLPNRCASPTAGPDGSVCRPRWSRSRRGAPHPLHKAERLTRRSRHPCSSREGPLSSPTNKPTPPHQNPQTNPSRCLTTRLRRTSARPPRSTRSVRSPRQALERSGTTPTDDVNTGITLTSRKVQALEKVCQELIERAKNKDLRAKGPVRLPTKTLKITVRRGYASSPG